MGLIILVLDKYLNIRKFSRASIRVAVWCWIVKSIECTRRTASLINTWCSSDHKSNFVFKSDQIHPWLWSVSLSSIDRMTFTIVGSSVRKAVPLGLPVGNINEHRISRKYSQCHPSRVIKSQGWNRTLLFARRYLHSKEERLYRV